MAFELSPEDQAAAEAWVAAGRFGSVEEAVHAALQSFQQEDDWHAYATDRIEAGLADVEAGRTIPGHVFMAWLKTFQKQA